MIDLRALRQHPDAYRASQQARGEDPGVVEQVLAADERRRAAAARYDTARAAQKDVGRAVAAAGSDRDALLAQARGLADAVKAADAEQATAAAELRAAAYRLGNLVDPAAPVGGAADFTVLEQVGEPPALDFPPRDHLELAERLGAVDVTRGAKVSGARFYFLTGVGAELELALVTLAMGQARAAGLRPVIPPALVRPEAMEGTGFLGAHAAEVYRLADDDLYLVGTAEVPLAAYHMDEIIEPADLPRRYVGYSPCFRREAGSYGRDTRGIIRVHWFDKVEMFSFTQPADAAAEHQRLLGWQKQFLTELELPFRVVDIATADLGASAARKFDCEVWLPSGRRHLELTSASNCTTFQARRLGVRTRTDDGTGPVATLNGTLCAVARTLVALLEVHQQPDGSVRVPLALRRHLGREVLEPA